MEVDMEGIKKASKRSREQDHTFVGSDTLGLAHSTDTTWNSSLNDRYEGSQEANGMSRTTRRRISSDSTSVDMKKEDSEENWTLLRWKQYYKRQSGYKRSSKRRSLRQILGRVIDKHDADVQCLPTCCSIDSARRDNELNKASHSKQGEDPKFTNENSGIVGPNSENCHRLSVSDDKENSNCFPTKSSVINLELEDESDTDKSNCVSKHMEEDDACSWTFNPCVNNHVSFLQSRASFNSPISDTKFKLINCKQVTRIGKEKTSDLFTRKCFKTVISEYDVSYSSRCSDIHFTETLPSGIMECEKNRSFHIGQERFEIQDDHDFQLKPTQIPCKRKAISPLTQEMLLRASRLDEFCYGTEKQDVRKTGEKFSGNKQSLQRSPCHNRHKPLLLKLKSPVNISSLPSSLHLVKQSSHEVLPNAQELSLVPHNSPLTYFESMEKVANTLAFSSSPFTPIPVKGILRSSLEACKDQCHCEKCASVRLRAKRASEFSQRQMQDIQGIAAMLMKDLSTLRGIVEDRLIKTSTEFENRHSTLDIKEVKIAASNALETEVTAKKWLVRMSRDSNRYCKLMRAREKKLTFADEKGGKLCHIRVFRSQPSQ